MFEYIKKLQSKPEEVRKQILVGSLIVCMSLVGFIWISGLSSRLSNKSIAKADDTIKPFTLFKQSISDTYSNVTASVGNISTSLKKKEEPKKEEKQIDLIPVEIQNQ